MDEERFRETRAFLAIQQQGAQWWRDAYAAYYQAFARRRPGGGDVVLHISSGKYREPQRSA